MTSKQHKTLVRIAVCLAIIILFICLKIASVFWNTRGNGDFDSERSDILGRRNYLVEKLVTTPEEVLEEMPSEIGPQFQGEWALYSCSMLSAALVNISHIYPDTQGENILYIERLIDIVDRKTHV